MEKMYFVVSDLHGHYDELMKALEDNLFNWEDDTHVLVVAGDWTDRGEQCAELYKLFKTHKESGKIIVTQGNHDKFLERYVNNYYNFSGYDLQNGLPQTIKSLSLANISLEEVVAFNKTLPPFFETKTHIITHASIYGTGDWRNPPDYKGRDPWMHYLHWDDGSFYKTPIENTNKTIVVGHFSTEHLRDIYKLKENNEQDHSILYSEDRQKVFIDTCTILTKEINVYMFED